MSNGFMEFVLVCNSVIVKISILFNFKQIELDILSEIS